MSFTAAYGNLRMAAYLFLPRRGRPPYQTVIYWPGSFATRSDIDTTRLAFYGHSWGGVHMPIVLAVEPRIRAGISFTGGLDNVRWLPEIDPFNFLSAVRTPILILASRYDPRFPFETSQKPMFELAATPPENKRLFVYDKGSHYMPMDLVARESLAWLDRYLGPARLAP